MRNVIAAAAVAIAASGPALAFEVKGLQMGQPVTAEQIRDVLRAGCARQADASLDCTGSRSSFAGEEAQAMVRTRPDGRLSLVTFLIDARSTEAVRAAMVEKFGAPTSEAREPRQNGYGATFESLTMVWEQPGQQLRLMSRTKDATKALVVFVLDEELAARRTPPAKRQGDM